MPSASRRRRTANPDGGGVADHGRKGREKTMDTSGDEAFVAQAFMEGFNGVGQQAGIELAQGFQLVFRQDCFHRFHIILSVGLGPSWRRSLPGFGLHFFTGMDGGAPANHHQLPLLEAGGDFATRRRFQSQRDGALLNLLAAVDHADGRAVPDGRRFDGNGQGVRAAVPPSRRRRRTCPAPIRGSDWAPRFR